MLELPPQMDQPQPGHASTPHPAPTAQSIIDSVNSMIASLTMMPAAIGLPLASGDGTAPVASSSSASARDGEVGSRKTRPPTSERLTMHECFVVLEALVELGILVNILKRFVDAAPTPELSTFLSSALDATSRRTEKDPRDGLRRMAADLRVARERFAEEASTLPIYLSIQRDLSPNGGPYAVPSRFIVWEQTKHGPPLVFDEDRVLSRKAAREFWENNVDTCTC